MTDKRSKKQLTSRRNVVFSASFLGIVAAVSFGSSFFDLPPWDAIDFELAGLPMPPSSSHWLGTDQEGRDVLSRILFGGQITLLAGIVTTLISAAFGTIYGTISGFVGGTIDRVMMAFVDLLYALPYYFIIILLMVFFRIDDIVSLFATLALFQWLGMARVIRGQVLSLREREFVAALRIFGASRFRIMAFHLIPNCMGYVAVYATLMVPRVMLQEAFLSYVGLGFQTTGTDGVVKPVTSWGVLLSEGARNFEDAWWLLFFPALIFSATLLAVNVLGDGLRDILADPVVSVKKTFREATHHA